MVILCTIDLETREVSLPAGQVIASYDHNVDVIRFQAEAIPGFSLNTSSIKIAAQGPNKARHDYSVDPATVTIEEETGYITFDWPIPAGVTEMPLDVFKYGDKGNLIFAVCAEIIDGSTVSKAWHSDDGIITVVAHLEPEAGGGEDPEEEATNAQKIAQLQTDVAVINTQVGALANGSPTPVATVAEMTDESAVYLYTGTETGYTAGNWYYYNGTAWTSGGTYGGATTSTTFNQHGVPADDFAVGEALAEKADADEVSTVNEAITEINDRLTEYDSIIYTEGGDEGGQVSGQIIQFDSADGIPEDIGVDGSGVSSGNLTICGVNIFPKFPAGSESGLTWTVDNDGVMSFTGTTTADVLIRMRNILIPTANEVCSFAFFNNMTNTRLSFFGINPENADNLQLNMTSVNTTATIQFAKNLIELRLRIPKDADWTGLTIKPMFVYGGTAPTEFTSYIGQTYAVTLGTDGKVNESVSYKTGVNTIFSNFGAVTAYMPVERRTIKEDFEALSEVVEKGNSLYKYEVSGAAKYLYVYYKSGKNWVRWQLHNVPAPNSNSDTWQIGRICGLDENLENLTELVRGGEFELAFKEHGAADYCGGNNHGDETTDVFKLFIDGEQITDLSTLPTTYTPFSRIDAFEIATVNRCNTPSVGILTHQKIWVFEDGKVTVRQTIKFLMDLSVDGMLVCMFAALRAKFPYGIRKGGVSIEEMTAAGFPHVSTTSDDVFYMLYGDDCTAKISAKTDNAENKSTVWINDTVDLNKLYYGYFGMTNSGAPTSVTAGTVCTEESVYEVAYTV